ncbi:hypothetical protein [Thiothrix subterranea]|uniref:Protein BatD n=1 Tax=Thiothrix subterranea TaxID=2735563 RepID=A0AA51R116_9GAMM|nr:hypothetical protein [Thiothrix subterranea]MDQ5767517.1 hypothetical protein [Thiothrix subterranea]WML88612.1 hypothetical protein RCG00_09585 [Thiothrix subterranea]
MVAADLPWTIQLEDAQVWQRERTTLTVEVQSTDRFATLEASLPRIEGVDVQALPATNEASPDGKRILRLIWQLSAHTPGKQTIQLPTIRYNLNGRDAAQWQPPLQMLDVQALPPYLPPTIPVGKVQIESRIEPSGWLQPDHLAYWHIRLHSDAVNTAQFPPILKQIQTTQGVEVFPATVGAVHELPLQTLNYRIPLKAQSSGKLDLPTLQWHWFDPETGRLERQQYAPPTPWVLAWAWRVILAISGGLLLLLGLRTAGYFTYRRLRRWRSKRQVQQALQQNADASSVRQTLDACSAAHGWPANLSTRHWLQHWEQQYGANPSLQTALHQHEAKRFASNSPG